MLPAQLKKQLAPLLGDGFIIKRSVFEQCLELYPMEQWDKEMSKINKLNRFNRKNIEFLRRYTAGVRQVDLDSSGRMLINKELVTFAHISKVIVLTVTVNNIIEIWDKDSYEEIINNSQVDFGDLAEEVMGGLDASSVD
jgi:MraZ protein